MIFYRYQNTKTLERNSFQYVDMNTLYGRAVDYIDECKGKATIDSIAEFLEDYAFELCYRQNLEEKDYGKLLKEIAKISIKYYPEVDSMELRNTFKKEAYKEIDDLMKPYPLKGLFVIPEYSNFNGGTKFSVSELRSNIITGLSASSAKYLAIYEGDVICEEMDYGGTLIKPTKLVNVFELFEDRDKSIGTMHPIFRDIEDEEELKESIEYSRESIGKYISWNMGDEHIKSSIKTYAKELIICYILRAFKTNYKMLDYRKVNNIHRVHIKKNNKIISFYIPEEDITLNDFNNRKNIVHRCRVVVKDMQGNIMHRTKGTLNVSL